MWPHHPQRRVMATDTPKRRRGVELDELAVFIAPARECGGWVRRRAIGGELDELAVFIAPARECGGWVRRRAIGGELALERFLFLVFFLLTGKMPSFAKSLWQN
jgi:hypothetical protein